MSRPRGHPGRGSGHGRDAQRQAGRDGRRGLPGSNSPARETEERLRQVLVHEIGHIQRWDVLTQALSSAACALYWFNPLVWIAARQMLVERERACDDLVLQSGAKPSSYAHGLLEIARSLGSGWAAARVSPAMARRSQISGRLLAVHYLSQ